MEGLEFDKVGELERGWLERRFERTRYYQWSKIWKGIKF